MDFNAYNAEVNHELDDKEYRKQTRKRLIIIGISTFVLIVVIIAAVLGMFLPTKTPPPPPPSEVSNFSSAQSIQEMCATMTPYPYSCISSISSHQSSSNNSDPKHFFKLSIQVSLNELVNLSSILFSKAYGNLSSDPLVQRALNYCEIIMNDAIGHANESIASLQGGQGEVMLSTAKVNNIRVWLSAAVTGQKTCLDGLEKAAANQSQTVLSRDFENALHNSIEFTSNSLEIASNIMKILQNSQTPNHNRKLLKIDGGDTWRRKFLERK
ncbi:hypothetical protein SLA2020_292400 [Shorea laevis]